MELGSGTSALGGPNLSGSLAGEGKPAPAALASGVAFCSITEHYSIQSSGMIPAVVY